MIKFGKKLLGLVLVCGIALACGSPAVAHNVFKKEISKKYPEKKISCNACHVDKKPKTERNDFGKLFHKQFAEQKLTENWKSKKGSDKKAYEAEVMIPAFQKALKNVTSMTYDDIIKAGMVSGIDDPNRAAENGKEN